MNKEKLLKDIQTFIEIYKTMGAEVAWSWMKKQIAGY